MSRGIIFLVFVTLMLNLSLILNFLFRKRLRIKSRLDSIGQTNESSDEEQALDRSVLLGKDIKAGKYRFGWLNQFLNKKKQQLAQADILMRPEEFVLICLGLGVILFLLVMLLSRIWFIGLVAGIIGYILPGVYVNLKKDKRAAAINKQLPESLDLIASGLRAGLSFAQAMNLTSKDMEQPIRGEFEKVLRDNTLGKTMEDALEEMVFRTKDEDIDLFVTAMVVQRQVGGNLAEILEIISNTLRERVRVKGEIRTLTAQSRISGIVIGFLPPGLAIVLASLNPSYMMPLFTTPMGIFMVALASFMTILGVIILMQMSKVEV